MSSEPPPEHYFTAEPVSPAQRRALTVKLAGRRIEVHTAPGIFCPDRIDQGTAVLLAAAPAPPATGQLLDLGCGWGPVALTLAMRSPGATVWAIDVNQRALALARDNAADLGLERFHACTPGDVPPGLRFATIWSNPPIRVGKAVLHDLLRTWLPRLDDGGAAYLVVQRNLGSDSLQRWLAEELESTHPGQFGVERLTSVKGFRLLAITRALP